MDSTKTSLGLFYLLNLGGVMEQFTLGIDIGTTSVKTLLLSSEGYIAAEESAPHNLISEKAGWAEEDATIWWDNVVKTVRTLAGKFP